ncbi:MAG: hypothetical protein J5803_00150 [Desulfovibrio sp.]|nr:hypothetical protein [Desulfovibrio sp.]
MLHFFIRKKVLCLLTGLLIILSTACDVQADVTLNAANFPDEHFRNWLKENVAQGKNILTKAQIASVEEMDISYSEISDLKGLEYFTALTGLICFSNNLKSLDVSKNPTMAMLRCNGNELSSLDLTKSKALQILSCDQNNLKTLDISALPNLQALSCRYNELTTLDLSHNPALWDLDIWGNGLTTLDVSKNTGLIKLNCLDNPIKELDLSKNRSLSEAALPETATVTLPGGDKIRMADFKIAKTANGMYQLDLSRFADKISSVSVEAEGVDEEVSVSVSKGVYSFAACDGKVKIAYKLGGDAVLDLIVFVEK